MEKIKVIDLLKKIANEEEAPQIISYEGVKYHIDELEHFYVNDNRKALLEYIFDCLNDFDALMTEVEILEEDKKIEKIIPTSLKGIDNLDEKIEIAHIDTISAIDKINEIIDRLNNE